MGKKFPNKANFGWVFNGVLWPIFYNLKDGGNNYIHRAEMERGFLAGAPFRINNTVTVGDRTFHWAYGNGEGDILSMPNGDPVMRPIVKPIHSDRLTPKDRRAIKSVSMSKEGVFKLEMHDRMKALELLGKHYGLFEKDNKQKGEGMADAITALVAAAQGAPLMPNAMGDDED